MKKVKHDHKGTKALKLTIFFSLMLAPLLAVLFKCCYVTFNKNAKDSYYGETINEVIYNDVTQLSINKEYRYENDYLLTNVFDNDYLFKVTDVKNFIAPTINSDLQNALDNNLVDNFRFTNSNNRPLLNIRNSSNLNLQNYFLDTIQVSFDFDLIELSTQPTNYYNLFSTISYNKDSYLDNAFYYAIDEMKNNELFNWTTNTALYTPTSAMTTGMGITTNALPILITYWLYLTAIYIVIDIVVELFTYLTHMITGRISA